MLSSKMTNLAVIFVLILFICLIKLNCYAFASEPIKSTLELQVSSYPFIYTDSRTNISLIKNVYGEKNKLKFQYDIITPKVNEFQFVLALDSSGSIGAVGDSQQAKAIIGAVPRFINDTIKENPDKKFKISIISWDDDLDFAYPQNKGMADIDELPSKMNELFGEIDSPRYLFRCSHYEHTNISEAIRNSIEILDSNKPDIYHDINTSKFIIAIVGLSEYYSCKDEFINNSKDKGYNIYIVGMGFGLDTENEMYNHLLRICGKNNFENTDPFAKALEEDLLKQLKKQLRKAMNEPVATKVILNDTFFKYISPEDTGTLEELKTTRRETISINKDIKNNMISIVLPQLYQDNITRITFYAEIDIKNLPVSLGNYSNTNLFESVPTNYSQNLSYTWLRIHNLHFAIKDCPINLSSKMESLDQQGLATHESNNPRSGIFSNLIYHWLAK